SLPGRGRRGGQGAPAAMRPAFVLVAAAIGLTPGAMAQEEPPRLAERAHQDRTIVYFLHAPETHAFDLYHDYTESREGMDHYLNVVRKGSTVSGPRARHPRHRLRDRRRAHPPRLREPASGRDRRARQGAAARPGPLRNRDIVLHAREGPRAGSPSNIRARRKRMPQFRLDVNGRTRT